VSRKEIIVMFLVAAFIGIGTGFSVYHAITPTPVMHTAPIGPQMPTQIDVNGTQWRIQLTTTFSDPNMGGFTDCSLRLIYIKASTDRTRTILMHELSHAAVCMGADMGFHPNNLYFNSTDNGSHEGVYHFSELWAEILYRNPDLAAYLGSKN
jgi:hypothetical protein